jgi:hypothetical protein
MALPAIIGVLQSNLVTFLQKLYVRLSVKSLFGVLTENFGIFKNFCVSELTGPSFHIIAFIFFSVKNLSFLRNPLRAGILLSSRQKFRKRILKRVPIAHHEFIVSSALVWPGLSLGVQWKLIT